MKRYLSTICFGVFALFFLMNQASGQGTENAYGRQQSDVFREKKVKEIRVERAPFKDGMRNLEQRLLIDENGRVIRRETASNSIHELSHRHDMTYDEQGNTLTFTSFLRRSEANGNAQAIITGPETEWVPSNRSQYRKEGFKKAGSYRFNPVNGKWVRETTIRTYVKNDTAYTITKNISYSFKNKKISRSYPLEGNKNVHRLDYLSYSPKGLSEPDYYYHKFENGRKIESGEVDFEVELFLYFEKHPEKRRYILGSKHGFYTIYDEMARHTPGTLKPNRTLTYNANGYLIAETSYGTRTTYEREPDGRLLSEKVVHSDNSSRLTTYFYNEQGLVEKILTLNHGGIPGEARFYQYTFY